MNIAELSQNGINILVLVFGLVEFSKKLGLKGNWLTVLAMVVGVIVGVATELAKMYPEVSKWYGVAVVGLAFGAAASGVYDFAKNKIAPSNG